MYDGIFVTRSSMPSYDEYCKEIKPLWDSHWLTNMGKYHQELEFKLREYLGVAEVSLTVNGHMALELAIQSYGFPEGSEVITTPFTFISTTHAIVRNGLVPVFCDIKSDDGTIDEKRIEEHITPKTVAILPVHVYGNICNVEAIQAIADRYGLCVIYDAAHAFGETLKGEGVASFGDASVFSFHATKVFNTIEGGAVCARDHAVYERMYNLKNFGIRGEELVVSVGANAKMNEFCAIMGLCNLRNISCAIDNRRIAYEKYKKMLENISGIFFFTQRDGQTLNYGYFPILIAKEYGASRDALYEALRERNIYARKYFYPITADHACFKNMYRSCNLPVAREVSNNVLLLPLFEGITEKAQTFVVDVIRECHERNR